MADAADAADDEDEERPAHLDVADDCGCAEVWEELSERREEE